ncbi:MAG: glycosyltransferase family 4 protein, partial [Nitrospinota bacterium]
LVWWADTLGLRKLCQAERAEILHAHRGQEHWLAAAALRLSVRWDNPLPVLIRSRHILEAVRTHPANRWLYNRATARTLTATRGILQRYLQSGAFHPSRFVVLRGGVDAREFRPEQEGRAIRARLGIAEGDVTFGMTSSFVPIKGHMTALEALAILRRRGLPARLLLASSGGDQDRVARHAAELDIADAVHFLGYRQDLPRALSAADVGLFAARRSEGTSRVVLEWMALGRPVVATDVGCVRELLGDGKEGLIVPLENTGALADAMERLVLDAALRRRLGAEARARAETEYDRQVWTARTEAIYREALGRPPAQPPPPSEAATVSAGARARGEPQA